MKDTSKWSFDFTPIFEWAQLFGRYNWTNITFVEASVELNPLFGYVDINLVLLGIGMYLTVGYPHKETEEEERVGERLKDLEKQYADASNENPKDSNA